MSKEIYEKLIADFPVEAYGVDKSRGFPLTTLQAQWIKERLNTVFGVFGWDFDEQFECIEGKGIICHGTLIVKDENNQGRRVKATGGCAYKEKGQTISDPYKSAATEALSKACSYIGIGNEMYKGLVSADKASKPRGKVDAALLSIKAAKTKDEIAVLRSRVESRKWEPKELEELTKSLNNREKEIK